jgi:hypothetical protein
MENGAVVEGICEWIAYSLLFVFMGTQGGSNPGRSI